jgi:hypothetical protein
LGIFDGEGDRMTFEIEIDEDFLVISKVEDKWDFFEPAIWALGFVFIGLQVIRGQSLYHLNLSKTIEFALGGTLSVLIIGLGSYKQQWKLDKKSGIATKISYRLYGCKQYIYVLDQMMKFEVIEQASSNVDIIFSNLVASGDVSATQSRSLTSIIAPIQI